MYLVKQPNGDTVECYGELADNSNFEIVCEDEEDDGIWCDGNINSKDGIFTSWEEVVEVIQVNWDAQIIEISAV